MGIRNIHGRNCKFKNMMKEMDLNSRKNILGRRYVLWIFEIIYDTILDFLAVLYCIVFVMPFFFFVRMGQYKYATQWDILREPQKEFRGMVFETCKYKEVCESYRKEDGLCDKKAEYGCDHCITFEMKRGQCPIV